jgi:ATP-binding protein involved in chromosome partitioning
MNVDDLRRAWDAAAEASGVEARLVAMAGTTLRGRTGAPWRDRVRFEVALLERLGETEADLQWLAPRAAARGDGARARLGLPTRSPAEVSAKRRSAEARGVGKAPVKGAATAVPGVRHVLAVASGKGGVGKSTLAVNLALAMQAQGRAVGVLDADVYGPSMPTMLGSFAAPTKEDGKFRPVDGPVPFLSMGLMVNPDQSLMWRGPLVQRMVRDFLQGTQWPDLDVLVIDLPPGTGDVQLTLVQKALLDGAVVVSTPQDVALIDAARAVQMFRSQGVPLLGLVENMAGWACPACGEKSSPFGLGGAEQEAQRLGLPFLGRVPLDSRVREGGDAGTPVVQAAPESEAAQAIARVASSVLEALGTDA